MTRSKRYDDMVPERLRLLCDWEDDEDDNNIYDPPPGDLEALAAWENPYLNGDFTALSVVISDLPGPQLRAYLEELEYA